MHMFQFTKLWTFQNNHLLNTCNVIEFKFHVWNEWDVDLIKMFCNNRSWCKIYVFIQQNLNLQCFRPHRNQNDFNIVVYSFMDNIFFLSQCWLLESDKKVFMFFFLVQNSQKRFIIALKIQYLITSLPFNLSHHIK